MLFTLDAYDPQYVEFCVSVKMNQYHGFFAKLWVAVKYLFGRKCKDAVDHWDTVMLKIEDVDRLIEMLQKYKRLSEE